MAKVKAPLMSESAVGQLGGLLYRNNQYGHVVSRRSISPSLRTPTQTIHRGLLKTANNAWRALTPEIKLAWEAFADPPQTARNAFVGTFLRWRTVGQLGNPTPNHVTHRNVLSNFQLFTTPGVIPYLLLTWDYDGDYQDLLEIKCLTTWSHRTSPKPGKLLIVSTTIPYAGSDFFPIKCQAPIIHLKLTVVQDPNGQVQQEILLRFEVTW